ncbi:MAG TPA: hypothetical protein VN847_18025 [Streptosporangiaceae bacterium]|nr:hypothetical protein [Streptosporangiaceae bacterium]
MRGWPGFGRLTDLAGLAPQDAIASVAHTARAIARAAIQSSPPGRLPA